MRRKRILDLSTALFVAGCLAFGVTACGGSDAGNEANSGPTTEITPHENAPASAGDKRDDAPDDAISDRPGGPNQSKPAAP